MAKNDNPHALRFLDSMEKHGKKEAAEKFSEDHPLSKSADFTKKFVWAKDVCAFLDTNYDEELIKEIRMDCACGPELGEIIAKATGRTLIDFAKDRLFAPLEIAEFHWLERDGHALAADGLRIKISDLIKLAELYLNKGIWHGKRIVSEEWISESLFPRFLTYEYIGNYGYHVWSKEIQIRRKNVRAYFALGYRGQFAVLIPDLKITAAIVSDVNDSMRPFYLLIDSINDLI